MTITGLAALCALALSAVAASGASAGTTAFTCVAGQGAANTNADCQPGSTGTSGHVGIAANTSTTLKLNKLTNPVLTGKLFGATAELSATGVECVSCHAENKEVGGVMEFTGKGALTFTGVKVVGLESKCVVESAKPEDIGTKPLKFTTVSSGGLTFEPETGTTLAEFQIFNVPGQTCTVQGLVKITGIAPVTLDGSKLKVNITKASGLLQANGEKASLTGEGTIEAGPTAAEHPVALTTA
jgi:hypothetical protein